MNVATKINDDNYKNVALSETKTNWRFVRALQPLCTLRLSWKTK